MSIPMIPITNQTQKSRRPLIENTGYLGKRRVATCCAQRRYHLQPDACRWMS